MRIAAAKGSYSFRKAVADLTPTSFRSRGSIPWLRYISGSMPLGGRSETTTEILPTSITAVRPICTSEPVFHLPLFVYRPSERDLTKPSTATGRWNTRSTVPPRGTCILAPDRISHASTAAGSSRTHTAAERSGALWSMARSISELSGSWWLEKLSGTMLEKRALPGPWHASRGALDGAGEGTAGEGPVLESAVRPPRERAHHERHLPGIPKWNHDFENI